MIGVWRLTNWVLTRVFGPQLGVYNGVAVRDCDVLEPADHEPNHKQHLVAAVRETVSPGDRVVVVGGGRAVVAVHAARCGGDVNVFEAGDTAAELSVEVADLNDVEFQVEHAVVGSAENVTGEISARRVDPEQLTGDILVLDCEGAERDILPVDGFENVIVETHPKHGSSLSVVRKLLPETASVVGIDSLDGEVVVA